MNMKNLLNCSTVMIIVAVCCCMSCNSDNDNCILSNDATQDYFNDLELLKNKQIKLFDSSTRASEEIDDEKFMKIAQVNDSLTKEFIIEHQVLLKNYLPLVLSQDSIELVSIDEEAMHTYLAENFSEGFVQTYFTALKQNAPIQSGLTNGLNPLESLMIVNTDFYSQLTNLYMDKQIATQQENKTDKQQKCLKEYNIQINKCYLAANFIYVIGGGITFLATLPMGPAALTASVIADSFFSIESMFVLKMCADNAKNNYNQCLKK